MKTLTQSVTALLLITLFALIYNSASAQGPYLAFSSDRTGRYQIFKVKTNPLSDPVSAGMVEQVTFAGSGNQESRSPDWFNQNIAYQFGASGVRGIHSIKPNGMDDIRLTLSGSDERDPSWSPDGRFIVYSKLVAGSYDIWIHKIGNPNTLDDDDDYALLTLTGSQEQRPVWSPDMNRIAFITFGPNTNNRAQIAIVPIAESEDRIVAIGPHQQLTSNSFAHSDPTWAPDSLNLVYSTTRNGARDIYRLNINTGEGNAIQLTTNTGNDTNPAWSPDGGSIAFVSDRTGNRQIYVMSSQYGEDTEQGGYSRRINTDSANNDDPAWERVSPCPQWIDDVRLSARTIHIPSLKFSSGVGVELGYKIKEFFLDFEVAHPEADPNILCRYRSVSTDGPQFHLTCIGVDRLLGQVRNRVILDIFRPGTMPVDQRVPFLPNGGATNDCILNGGYDPNAYYLRWDSPSGFTIDLSDSRPGDTRATDPLTYWVNLNRLSLSPETTDIDQIIRKAEEYIHIILLINLPTIGKFHSPIPLLPTLLAIIDPGQVNILVTDPVGRSTGILADGTQVTNIPDSFYFSSTTNPAVIVLNYGDGTYQAQIRGVVAGDYSLSALTTNPTAVNTTEKVLGGQIGQNQSLTFPVQVETTANGPAVRLIAGETATASGTVTLEECADNVQPVTFEFRPVGSGFSFSGMLTLPSNGAFSFTDVPRGNYNLAIIGHKWLRKTVPVDVSSNNITNLIVTLLGGDANGDNSVDVLDLDILIQAFDAVYGDTSYNDNADFNCDNSVDVLDLDLLIRNFDRQGDP